MIPECVAFSATWCTPTTSNKDERLIVNTCDVGCCNHPDIVDDNGDAFCAVFLGRTCSFITPEGTPAAAYLRQRISDWQDKMRIARGGGDLTF